MSRCLHRKLLVSSGFLAEIRLISTYCQIYDNNKMQWANCQDSLERWAECIWCLWLRRSVESLFASGLQHLNGALLLRLIDWLRLVILGVFGYVGGSHIFASRRIRPRIVTSPGFISLHSQVCFVSVRALTLSLSPFPLSHPLPPLSFCFSFSSPVPAACIWWKFCLTPCKFVLIFGFGDEYLSQWQTAFCTH